MSPKPLLLLADSRPLYRPSRGVPVLERVRARIPKRSLKAAYLGASNGDEPAFFEIFRGAMEKVPGCASRMIHAEHDEDEAAWLAESDLIFLAGGDPVLGWRAMERTGRLELLRSRHEAGALLIGLSAGAMQLGVAIHTPEGTLPTLGLAPYLVHVHDEARRWRDLIRAVRAHSPPMDGLGIPSGGATLCHPDGTLEVWCERAKRIACVDGALTEDELAPGARANPDT